MSTRRSFAAVRSWVFAIALAGCAGGPDRAVPPPDPPGQFVALTTSVIMLGDTQEHEATGFPLHDNDNAVDAYVEVAQRPAEQPLFGRRILEWVLENHAGEPIIHLGDLMDVSCRSEEERLRKIMAAAKQPGAILPGNHDGLMFGIFNYDVGSFLTDRDGARWDRACRRAAYLDGDTDKPVGQGGAYTKKDFIAGYLEGIATSLPAGKGPAMPSGDGEWQLSWRNQIRVPFVEAIEAVVTPARRYARSFIAQKLRLPKAEENSRPVIIIALDTNQIDMIVGGLDAMRGISPGNVGHVQASQIATIAAWVEAARDAGEIVLFAGHHDWSSLSRGTRQRLAAMMERLDHPLVYFSAHTHSGFWGLHEAAGRNLLELNVSSLSDWPIAYRRVTVEFDARANRIKIVGDLMPQAGRPARDDLELLHMWERVTCAQAGVPLTVIQRRDLELVKAQRDGRGSLFQWLSSWLGGDDCEECTATLYQHALVYLDLMLTAIKNTSIDLGREVPKLATMPLPAMCSGRTLGQCVELLKETRSESLAANIDLFRKKANLIDRANSILDQEDSPRAKAYMTCRAVQAARDDFEMTPESSIAWRTEAVRRAGQFFRIEATVGMEPAGAVPPSDFKPPRPNRGRAGRP